MRRTLRMKQSLFSGNCQGTPKSLAEPKPSPDVVWTLGLPLLRKGVPRSETADAFGGQISKAASVHSVQHMDATRPRWRPMFTRHFAKKTLIGSGHRQLAVARALVSYDMTIGTAPCNLLQRSAQRLGHAAVQSKFVY